MRSGLGFRMVTLGEQELARAGASDVLALDARAFGRPVRLRAAAPIASDAAPSKARVGVVEVYGPIAQRAYVDGLCAYVDGYDAIEIRIGAALEDPEVDAVALVIDSPGGDVAGLLEAARRIRGAVQASGKKVTAYVDELAASAAYALACVASEIVVPTLGEVGSIGTLGVYLDRSRALDKAGVTPTIIRSGSQKAILSGIEPLTDEGRALIQSRVGEAAQVFAVWVAEQRGGTAAQWLALEGATARGARAVELGLADRVGALDEVLNQETDMGEQKKPAALSAREEEADLLSLGRAAMALTNASTVDEAMTRLGAWQGAAVRAAELEAKAEAEAKDAEVRERLELITAAVASQKIVAAKAWALDANGLPNKSAGIADHWASMKLKHLRASLASIEPRASAASPKPSGEDPNDIDRAAARRAGVAVDAYMRGKNDITAAMAAQRSAGGAEEGSSA